MKEFILKLTPEQHDLLAKHLGKLHEFYTMCYSKCDKKFEDMYLSYINEVNELIELLFTTFNKPTDELVKS